MNDANRVDDHLKAIVKAYRMVKGIEPPSVETEARLKDDLDLDSLDLIEMGMILEESGAGSIDARDAAAIQTVADVLALFDRADG